MSSGRDITGGAAVRERLDVLRRYWSELDAWLASSNSAAAWLSTLAGPGPKESPNFVSSDDADAVHDDNGGETLCPPGRLFSAGLVADIEHLWGTKVLARWPDRLVTEPAPHDRVAAAFGPYLAHFLLEAVGVWMEHERSEYGPTPTTTLQQARDALTQERRAWAREALDDYVRSRWQRARDNAVTGDERQVRQQPSWVPTAREAARLRIYAANQWFGGDLTGVHAALGLPAPAAPTRAPRLIPQDPEAFARAVHARLQHDHPTTTGEHRAHHRRDPLGSLAALSIRYLQLQEALGHPPRMGELGKGTFLAYSPILDDEPAHAWRRYRDLITDVVRDFERNR
jgi:hypothetical protein